MQVQPKASDTYVVFHIMHVLVVSMTHSVAIPSIMFLWLNFVQKLEHDPARVRSAMLLALIGVSCIEVGLATRGITYTWVAWVSLLINAWGGFDAILRFPAAHKIDSFFARKQTFLVVLKACVYTAGVVSIERSLATFVSMLMMSILGLPAMYMLALPANKAEHVMRSDEYDVDLVLRLWQMAFSPTERLQCIVMCKSWWHSSLSVAAESSPIASLAVSMTSQRHQQTLRRKVRCV